MLHVRACGLVYRRCRVCILLPLCVGDVYWAWAFSALSAFLHCVGDPYWLGLASGFKYLTLFGMLVSWHSVHLRYVLVLMGLFIGTVACASYFHCVGSRRGYFLGYSGLVSWHNVHLRYVLVLMGLFIGAVACASYFHCVGSRRDTFWGTLGLFLGIMCIYVTS